MSKVFLIAGISFVGIGVVLLLFWQDTRTPPGEKVVEFTYSRTQPCNTEYYNYGFSIGPLRDRIMCWSGSKGASQLDFHSKVKAQIKTLPEMSELHIADEKITEVIRRVEFSIVKDVRLAHPIKCKIIVRASDISLADLVARAFALAMMHDLEQENESISWKATMDKGVVCKRWERELSQLRKRISDKTLSVAKRSELKEAINNAERSLNDAKLLWDASIRDYREKWDASIVFIDEPNSAK